MGHKQFVCPHRQQFRPTLKVRRWVQVQSSVWIHLRHRGGSAEGEDSEERLGEEEGEKEHSEMERMEEEVESKSEPSQSQVGDTYALEEIQYMVFWTIHLVNQL